MRTECKHYESRSYPNGDTVRKCDLDLAPEAPWRCPEDCPAFTRRSDVAWSFGSLTHSPPPEEPPSLEGAAELLDAAEDVLNEVGPQVLAEVEAERQANARRGWRRWFRRGGQA